MLEENSLTRSELSMVVYGTGGIFRGNDFQTWSMLKNTDALWKWFYIWNFLFLKLFFPFLFFFLSFFYLFFSSCNSNCLYCGRSLLNALSFIFEILFLKTIYKSTHVLFSHITIGTLTTFCTMWNNPHGHISEFLRYLNVQYPFITFALEIGGSVINFVD